MTKQTVTKRLTFDFNDIRGRPTKVDRTFHSDLDGKSLADVAAWVAKIMAEIPPCGSNPRFDFKEVCEFGECSEHLHVVYDVLETDEEYEMRLAVESDMERGRLLKEQAEYERLRAKFEKPPAAIHESGTTDPEAIRQFKAEEQERIKRLQAICPNFLKK
jgi:hypothetical protein